MSARRKERKAAPVVETPIEIKFTPDNPFECPGLREDNPRDFLAALGLFRLLTLAFPSHVIGMAWTDRNHPIYSCRSPLPADFLAFLTDELKRLDSCAPHPFIHHKIIAAPPREFRAAILRALEASTEPGPFARVPMLLYAAYGSQVHTQDKKEEIEPSAFSFSNGQGGKELLRDVGELINEELSWRALVLELSGDRSTRRSAKSFRWHPAEYRAAAYRAADPGSRSTGDFLPDYPSANLLAFFGLTFFPVADRRNGRGTLGFGSHQLGRRWFDCFTWPVWSYPASVDEVLSLLHRAILHSPQPAAEHLRLVGVERVWRSRRFSADKSVYFAPARQIA